MPQSGIPTTSSRKQRFSDRMADPTAGLQAFTPPAAEPMYHEAFRRRTVHLSNEVWDALSEHVGADADLSKAGEVEAALRKHLGMAPLQWDGSPR